MRSKIGWILGAAALVVMLGGCGKTPPPPLPMPAPAPQTNPYGGGGYVGGGVSACGAVGGMPFSQSPFYGNLSSQYSYTSGNSIQLTLSYQQQYMNGTSQYQSLLGSAMLNLPDLMSTMQPGYPTQQQMPTSFCVSSMPTTGGQPFPGTYAPQDRSIAITMYGYVQSPLSSPYDPYSYGGGFTQVPVTVTIGQGCAAYLYDNRVMGCVLVKIGNQGQARYYQAQ